MGFYITHIYTTILMLFNSLAILNEQRFLRKLGLDTPQFDNQYIQAGWPVIKNQLVLLLFTARKYGRYLLIPLNLIGILFEILMG